MGNNTRLWEDHWVGQSSLASLFPCLYRFSCNNNALISSVISWNSSNTFSWDISFRRDPNDREISDFLGLLSIINDAPLDSRERDKRLWVGEKSGSFSCKSFFELLIDFLNDDIFVPHKLIWKTGIPPKVKVFTWLASWKRVNTCDLLQIRRPYVALSPSWCILCKNENESIDHLLLHCRFAQFIWDKVRMEFEMIGAMPTWVWNGNL